MKNNFSKLLTAYLGNYLPNQIEVSKNTVSSYCDTFKLLLRYCRDEKSMRIDKFFMEDISSDLIYSFLIYLENERGCSNSTINQRLFAIRSFFKYVQTECPDIALQCSKILDIRKRRAVKPLVGYISENEMKSFLSRPDTSKKSGRRDMVLLSVMYDTGARVQEIANITVRDVRLEYPARIRLLGKGQKTREVPILPNTAGLLENYMRERDLIGSDKLSYSLFTNKQSQKLTRAGIGYIISKYSDGITPVGGNHVSPHVLRHTKAMHLLQAGVNLVYIKDILGHVDISTTETYAAADLEMKRKALEQAAPVTPENIPIWQQDKDLLTWLNDISKPNYE